MGLLCRNAFNNKVAYVGSTTRKPGKWGQQGNEQGKWGQSEFHDYPFPRRRFLASAGWACYAAMPSTIRWLTSVRRLANQGNGVSREMSKGNGVRANSMIIHFLGAAFWRRLDGLVM